MQRTNEKTARRPIRAVLTDALSSWLSPVEGKPIRRIFRKESVLRLGREAAFGALTLLLARGAAYGGTRPFGLALLSATGHAPAALLGMLLFSILPGGSLLEAAAAILIFACRTAAGWLLHGGKEALWREPLPIRLAIGTAGGFTVGMVGIVLSGFTLPSLGAAVFGIAAVPASAFLLVGLKAKGTDKKERLHRQAGRLLLLFASVLSLNGLSLFGLPTARTAALFLSLAAAGRSGAAAGGLCGLVTGLACGIPYAPLMALSGAAAGLLRDRGPLISAGAAVGVGLLFSVTTEGAAAVLTTIPSLLWGGTLYLPAERLGWLARIPTWFEEAGAPAGTTLSELAIRRRREEDEKEVLSSLSGALSSLSAVFYTLSDRLASPGSETLHRLCEESLRRYCKSCSRNGLCYGEAYDETAEMINKLAAGAATTGRCDPNGLPKELRNRCPHLAETASSIRHGYARLLEEASRQNKTEVFAFDYEAIAALLSAAAEETAGRYRLDEAMTARVGRAAEEMHLPVSHIAVFGERQKTLLAGGHDLARSSLTAAEMAARFRADCGLRLSVPEFRVEGGFTTMTAVSAPILACESARASRRKEKETVNGDSAVIFDNREQYYYALLCDGMGSGTDAALTSRITCLFLQKLLGSGNRKDIVLKMLNHFIRSKNLECFTTVDLLEIDLLTGDASFVKSGAAPSYVLRAGKLFQLTSRSLPIGITREITAEELRFRLLPGDLVVMISDGVSQGYEDGAWLASYLSERLDPAAPLPSLTRRILEEADRHNDRSDDMTVTLIRVADAA